MYHHIRFLYRFCSAVVWAMSTTLHKAGKLAHGWKQKLQADPSSHEKTHPTFKELDYFRDLISVDSHPVFFCDWVLLIKKLFSNEFSAHSSDHCTKFFARNLPCVSLLCNFSIWCICMSVYMSEHMWNSGDSLQAPVLSAVSIPGIELGSSGLLADVFSAFVLLRVTCMFSAFVFLHANHSGPFSSILFRAWGSLDILVTLIMFGK